MVDFLQCLLSISVVIMMESPLMESAITKEKAIEWLKNIGLSTSGNKRELIIRINKYKRYRKLVAKLQGRAKRYFGSSSLPEALQRNRRKNS